MDKKPTIGNNKSAKLSSIQSDPVTATQVKQGDFEPADSEEADLAFRVARANKTRADARLAEIEVSKARGELVATVDVAAAWSEVLVGLRAKLLSIPTKAGATMAAETDQAVIEAFLEDQIRDALEELASYQPEFDPSGQTIRRVEDDMISVEGEALPKSLLKKRATAPKKQGRRPYKPRRPGGGRKKKGEA